MDIERLEVENARLKRILQQSGFTIKYKETGEIARVIKPRAPKVKHTAVTWANKKGYQLSVSQIRRVTKDRAVTERKFKNLVHRDALIKESKAYLAANGFQVPSRYFDKVPTYALESNDFYQNVNAVLNSTAENDDQRELEPEKIRESIDASVNRIRKARGTGLDGKKKVKKKPKMRLRLR